MLVESPLDAVRPFGLGIPSFASLGAWVSARPGHADGASLSYRRPGPRQRQGWPEGRGGGGQDAQEQRLHHHPVALQGAQGRRRAPAKDVGDVPSDDGCSRRGIGCVPWAYEAARSLKEGHQDVGASCSSSMAVKQRAVWANRRGAEWHQHDRTRPEPSAALHRLWNVRLPGTRWPQSRCSKVVQRDSPGRMISERTRTRRISQQRSTSCRRHGSQGRASLWRCPSTDASRSPRRNSCSR